MKVDSTILQKVEDIAWMALTQVGTADVEKKVRLALRFAVAQPPEDIILDGNPTVAVTVDIATVFSPEGHYYQYTDESGAAQTAERVQALSIVMTETDAVLCKTTYDALGNGTFVNAQYWATTLDLLTERYIC